MWERFIFPVCMFFKKAQFHLKSRSMNKSMPFNIIMLIYQHSVLLLVAGWQEAFKNSSLLLVLLFCINERKKGRNVLKKN